MIDKKDFILSTSDINVNGFSVDTNGISLQRFLKNPIALFNHNEDEPIGIWENIIVENNKLIGTLVLNDELDNEDKTIAKIIAGVLKATSISFEIVDILDVDGVVTITKCNLLEVSIVSLPANENCIRLFLNDEEVSNKIDTVKLSFNKEPIETFETLKEKYNLLNNNFISLSVIKSNSEKEIVSLNTQIDTLSQQLNTDKEQYQNKLKSLEKEVYNFKSDNILSNAVSSKKIFISEISTYKALNLPLEQLENLISGLQSKNLLSSLIEENDLHKSIDNSMTYFDYFKENKLQELKVSNPYLFFKLEKEYKEQINSNS